MIRLFQFSVRAAGLLCLAAATSGQLAAQVFSPLRTAQSARFIEAPRFVEQELGDAEDAIAAKQYSDAVVRLGDLLQRESAESLDKDSLAGQDFFLIDDAQDRSQHQTESLLRRARKIIGELPPAALDTYELQYGPIARRTFDEASAARDWDGLRDVRRKFFHTKAGYEASLILAQHELFSGHPLHASLLLDAIVQTPRAIGHLGESVKEIHAAALHLSGREPNPQIAERYAVNQQAAGGKIKDYAVFGGKADRNGGSAGQLPLGNLRWDLPTTASPREEQLLLEKADELLANGKLPAPSWIPIRVGDHLLMRTTDRLFGVDYRTGKRVWQYPWYGTSEDSEEESAPLSLMGAVPVDGGPSNLVTQRVWNDLPYGQISSDGERVFMITDLAEVEIAQFSQIMGFRGTRPADTSTNTLVALDLATEGKLRWRLGKVADQASMLSDAFFLGPPLPLDGRLYVMVELAGDILLVCLDPATGDELWRQQLVAVESGSVDFDAVRRIAGASPTYHEGVLICPTGAGATVAIDLVDRMLRWGVSYPRKSDANQIVNRRNSVEPSRLMQRWHSGLAIAAEKSVLITPIESDRLFCFDLLSGSAVFKDRSRGQLRYLAGVRDDKFLLVGQQELHAYDLQSGDLVWRTPSGFLAAGQQIAGRGVFGEHDFFVPTTANQLLQVSLEDGAVLSRRTTRYPLGNLVAVDGEIISQGATRLSVAFGEASLEPLVTAMLQKNPNDFYALVRQAELLLQRQQLRDALERLNQAGKIDPESDEVHMLSVAAMLGILREDPSGEQEIVAQLDAMIDQPNQRAEFLGLLVRGALTNGRLDDAAGRLLELSQLLTEESSLNFAADDIINDITRQCTLDSWLAARMKDVVMAADQEQLREINQRVNDFVASNSHAVDSLLTRLVRHFESLDTAEARNELGRRYLDGGEALKLERLALGSSAALSSELSGLSDQRLLMLAEAFALGERVEDALDVIEILENREAFSDQARLEALRNLAVGKSSQFEWDDTVGLKWQSQKTVNRGMAEVDRRLSRTLVTWGHSLRGWQLISEGANTVALRDPFGQPHAIPLDGLTRRGDDGDKEAIISGGIMIVVRPGEIDAIDLNRLKGNQVIDSILWKRNFSGDGLANARRANEMNSFGAPIYWYRMNSPTAKMPMPEFRVGPILGDRLMVLHGGDLLAIDLATSETLWRNSNAPPSGTIVADGDRVAVVSPDAGVVKFYDKLDGRSLDSQPWKHGKIWHSMGEHVLSELPSEDKRRAELKIVNPFSGQVLQQLETSTASRAIADGERTFGQIVDSRYMVLLDTNGKLRIWDIQAGTVLSELETTPNQDLQKLHAMALDGQLIVIPEGKTPTLPDAVTLQTRYLKAGHQTAHALHAVSLADGNLRWSVEFDDLPWGCTISQPIFTPVILLTRSFSTYSSTNARTVKLDVQAIDVDTGEVLHERLGKGLSANTSEIETRMTIQPVGQRVIAQVSGEILTYFFGKTDEEVAGDP